MDHALKKLAALCLVAAAACASEPPADPAQPRAFDSIDEQQPPRLVLPPPSTTKPMPEAAAAARELAQEGRVLANAARHRPARVKFVAAYQLVQSPRLLIVIAKLSSVLGEHEEARRAYTIAADFPDPAGIYDHPKQQAARELLRD